jgi:hypothetical protein
MITVTASKEQIMIGGIKRAIQSGDDYPQAMKRAIITSVLTLLSADVVDYAFRDTNLWFSLFYFGVRNFQLYLPIDNSWKIPLMVTRFLMYLCLYF